MTRILVATDNYPPRYDGISRFLTEIIPALSKQHDVEVLAPNFGHTDDAWPVHKIGVVRWRVGDFHPAGMHFWKILRIVRKHDVIFLQTLGSIGMLALIAAALTRKKVVLFTHSIEWELVPRSLESTSLKRFLPGIVKAIDRIVYRFIDLLLIPGASVDELYAYNKIDNKRMIVHLGVDTSKFTPPRSKSKAKEAVGINPEKLVVGYHGRLAREKDIRTLLRGFKRFAARHDQRECQLLIVGDGLHDIRRTLEDHGAIVTGFQDDVVPWLQAMDCYVLASRTETSSLSVMEAMSCGLAVISTPVGFVQDYINDGENGLFFPMGDPVMLAFQLERLTEGDMRKRLGTAARKTMRRDFSWDETRASVMHAFETL